jgi:hypothetical protein
MLAQLSGEKLKTFRGHKVCSSAGLILHLVKECVPGILQLRDPVLTHRYV